MFCTHLWGMWDVLYIQLGKRICSVHTFGECGRFCTYSQGRGYVLYIPLGNVGGSVHTVREGMCT